MGKKHPCGRNISHFLISLKVGNFPVKKHTKKTTPKQTILNLILPVNESQVFCFSKNILNYNIAINKCVESIIKQN